MISIVSNNKEEYSTLKRTVFSSSYPRKEKAKQKHYAFMYYDFGALWQKKVIQTILTIVLLVCFTIRR